MNIQRSGSSIDLDAFLARPLIAHLATSLPDGARESPVWFLWEQPLIWLIGTSHDSFPKRIAAEPRCAIGFVDFDPAAGILQHVGMRGTATIERLDDARAYRLLARYLGPNRSEWNPTFTSDVIDRLNLMIRFKPDSIVVRDQSYFK